MRALTEEAKQTLPKSVDNTTATVGDLVQAKGANLSALQSGSAVDFHKMFQQSKNVEAVLQQMHGRQRAANLQQAAAQSQVLSGAMGSAHAERRPLQHEAILRHHEEMRDLVRSLRPEERSLVANASLPGKCAATLISFSVAPAVLAPLPPFQGSHNKSSVFEK